jgi:hypothetical protein
MVTSNVTGMITDLSDPQPQPEVPSEHSPVRMQILAPLKSTQTAVVCALAFALVVCLLLIVVSLVYMPTLGDPVRMPAQHRPPMAQN